MCCYLCLLEHLRSEHRTRFEEHVAPGSNDETPVTLLPPSHPLSESSLLQSEVQYLTQSYTPVLVQLRQSSWAAFYRGP